MRRQNLNLVLKPSLRDRLVAAAAADGRSMSGWVERVLEAHFREMDAGGGRVVDRSSVTISGAGE